MIRIITSLAAVLTIGSVQAQQTTVDEPPKLVVGITIDQLRGDYLQLFQNAFSERGFKRLLNEGLVYQNILFEFPKVDAASAIATIYTGTNPAYHGIVSENKYLREKQVEVSTFKDKEYIGNYTQETVSPKTLRASTITDELKVASQGYSEVYSFAPNLSEALITASHNGNCAFWVEDYSGKWASSTFYRDFYWVVDQENRNTLSYANKIWGTAWTPLMKKEAYVDLPYNKSIFFNQKLGADKETYKLFKKSPFVNESVVDISQKVIEKANLGKKTYPDFLSLTLFAGRFDGVADYSLEIQDSYVRLDLEIAKILDQIEGKVGLKNALIFVTSTGYYDYGNEAEETVNNIRGTFYAHRCEALLNMYLMAIYGRDNKWVDRYYDGQIYLNRTLIKDKEISLAEIQHKAAGFVSEFTGIQNVYTSFQIKHGSWSPSLQQLKNQFNENISGDLFLEVQPGFQILDEHDNVTKVKDVRNNAVTCPVFFLGSNIKPEKVYRTIKATEIAPSVTHILRIRSPNACTSEVLPELLQ